MFYVGILLFVLSNIVYVGRDYYVDYYYNSHLWDNSLLGGWLSRTILHHCWDLEHLVQKNGY